MRVDATTGAKTATRPVDLDESDLRDLRLADFHDDYQDAVRAITAMSTRVEELAESFPALLFAMASGYGEADVRARVFRMIIDGASLKDAADAYGLPYWLRKLPPQCFATPIPAMPRSESFARRIANFIPRSASHSASWFGRVCEAHTVAGPEYMLWMAAHKRFPLGRNGRDPLMLTAAWAWASEHPGTPAHDLLRMPWKPQMSLKRAYEEARAWERRVDLAVTLGAGVKDTWFGAETVNGYTFEPVVTIEDFLDEASAMGNCLDQYADPINNTHVRVFSIRKDGEHVANIELAPHDDDCLMPGIEQLRGPRNNRAAPEVWQAAYAWLGQQTFRVFPGPSHGGRTEVADAWQRIWGPILTDISDTGLRKEYRQFARRAHGCAGVQREASRLSLDI